MVAVFGIRWCAWVYCRQIQGADAIVQVNYEVITGLTPGSLGDCL